MPRGWGRKVAGRVSGFGCAPPFNRCSARSATRALPPQDGHLMPKRDNLKFQGGAATNTEGEQGNQGRKNRDHVHDGMAATQKSLGFPYDSEI